MKICNFLLTVLYVLTHIKVSQNSPVPLLKTPVIMPVKMPLPCTGAAVLHGS